MRVDFPVQTSMGLPRLPDSGGGQRPIARIVPHHLPAVVVDAEKIRRLAQGIEIGGGERRPGGAEDLGQFRRVGPQKHRIEILAVPVGVGPHGRRQILGRFRRRILRLQVDHQADLVPTDSSVGLRGGGVRSQQVMGDMRSGERVAQAGREHAVQVTAIHHYPGFVQGDPQPDPVVHRSEQNLRVVGEPAGAVGIEPTAPPVQRRRQVPVVQGQHRLDTLLQQRIHQSLVEIQPLGVDPAASLRQHPAPGHAKTVGVQTQSAHQRHVVPVAAIVIAG